MAHGFGAERAFQLPADADRFVDRGVAALLFDYRGFGDSEGPHQRVDPFRHRADRLAAVDGDRIGLWGTSFGGGHVVETAARRDVDAVRSQAPFVDGIATLTHLARDSGLDCPLTATNTACGTPSGGCSVWTPTPSRSSGRRRRSRYSTRLAPRPDTGTAPAESDWETSRPARVALRVPLYRPISRAGEVDAPPFLTVARGDRIVPPSAAERLARRLDHVDVYHGAPFERAVAEQAAFLARHLR